MNKLFSHWIFKFPLDRTYSDLTPLQRAWWGLWRRPGYSEAEARIVWQNTQP